MTDTHTADTRTANARAVDRRMVGTRVADVPRSLSAQRSTAAQTPSYHRLFHARDGGFTSVGVAVALLLALTLLFSAAQVRWVQSQSADIQYVADSGALAGGNVVAEYFVLVRVADAVVLSLSLLGMAVYGIAIVVSCIPSMQSVGAELLQFGAKVFKARDDCATAAAEALGKLQAALPFLIALNAASAIQANAGISASAARYHGLAIPLPLEGEDLHFPNDDAAEESKDVLSEKNAETAELTDAAEEAFKRMEQAKQEAYLADCGNRPHYCMYERAAKLAALSGGQNPSFSSVDTWLFDYAFMRAESYYAKRLAGEVPSSQALDEQVRSFCRERFYAYAIQEFSKGWCTTSPDGHLDANFPLLPKNTDEVRHSGLYTEQVFPVSADGVVHGSAACPGYLAAGAAGSGAIAGLEAGAYQECGHCHFAASTMGKVASASSAIENGFEYHYRIVAEAAGRYQQASEEYTRETEAAKRSATESFDLFKEAMQALKTPRLNPRPPGHNGVIALVIDYEAHAIPAGFTNPTVGGSSELKPRLALSAAALAEEAAAEGATILASFLDKAQAETEGQSFARGALGVFDGILEVWGSALLVYSRGGDALSEGLTSFLDGIPLVRETPLSRWANTALGETIEALGLEGADLSTPRPLLVNSIHVLRATDAPPARALLQAKERYSSYPGLGSTTGGGALFEGLTGSLASRGTELLASEFTLYEITFGDAPGLPRIPITLRLPANVVEQGQALIGELEDTLSASFGGGGNNAVWE